MTILDDFLGHCSYPCGLLNGLAVQGLVIYHLGIYCFLLRAIFNE